MAGDLGTGVDEGDAGVVVDRLGVHRADHGDVIGNASGVREEVTDPCAALAAGFEVGDGAKDGKGLLSRGHAGDALIAADAGREFLAVAFFHHRFVVEQIDVGGTAGHEQVDDAFGCRFEMRQVRSVGLGVGFQQGTEGKRADSAGGLGEEIASGRLERWFHAGSWIIRGSVLECGLADRFVAGGKESDI